MHDAGRLRRVKLLHTAIWAVLALCVLALPVAGWLRHYGWALALALVIVGECLVLALNRGRCPLTDVAARFTEDRAANFDIYLPNWLARHNKSIFGSTYVCAVLFVLWRWLTEVHN